MYVIEIKDCNPTLDSPRILYMCTVYNKVHGINYAQLTDIRCATTYYCVDDALSDWFKYRSSLPLDLFYTKTFIRKVDVIPLEIECRIPESGEWI